MIRSEILTSLNDKQREVVQHTEGPLLVLAGAGSGKTRSVIYRVAWLIKVENVAPWKILVVTFTNKAAKELKERLYSLLGSQAESVWAGTFHSICLKIIRYEIRYLPDYNAEFSVYDRDDQISVMRKIYKKMQIDKASYPYQKVLSIISRFKSQMIDINNFFDYYDKSKLNKLFYQIYEEYEKYLKANNAMDFDNILYYATEIFQNNPEVLEKYQKQFQYIMVDEYQDTNLVQIKFIYQLARKYKNICVVGDDDQSIYGWRGANIENILTFDEDYQNTKIVRLEQNYRSTSSILNLANNIIAHNKKRHKKQLWTKEESNVLPQLISHDNEYEEARYIAEEVMDLHSKKAMLQECVVLYRTNSQSRVLEQEFTKQQIPYVVVGGQNFYQRS
ncbi:MAG TPA: UvrD-helicase domain-containing protein, partial [Candidatus Cloacimonadota bacterium]|nr:UvrD-helicase domain-containing protein [Candidatus Cloacimonadota bacterium]